jgi:hypothetical protein
MSENLNLTDIINEALAEIDPASADNSTESQDEDLVDLDLQGSEADGDPDAEDSTEGAESDIEEDEEVDSDSEEEEDDSVNDDADSDVYVVKVDGEELEVSLEELKAGYSRQAHFTRSMQALKEEREAFEAEVGQHQETFEQLNQLDEAWSESPVVVLTNLLASTENPSYFLGLLIREAAANDLLTPDALQYFGIDDQTKQTWQSETEVERLRRELEARERADQEYASKNEASQAEARVQEAMRVFDNQVSEIISEESLDLPSSQDKALFKAELLRYARDNQILDLKKAYAAMSYEQARVAKAAEARRSQSVQKKNATKVVTRKSAGSSSVTKVNNTTDLRSIIEQSMRELGQ